MDVFRFRQAFAQVEVVGVALWPVAVFDKGVAVKIVNCNKCIFWKKELQVFFDKIYGVCTAIKEAERSRESKSFAYVDDCMNGDSVHELHTMANFGCTEGKQAD